MHLKVVVYIPINAHLIIFLVQLYLDLVGAKLIQIHLQLNIDLFT